MKEIPGVFFLPGIEDEKVVVGLVVIGSWKNLCI